MCEKKWAIEIISLSPYRENEITRSDGLVVQRARKNKWSLFCQRVGLRPNVQWREGN
jgi:hypothetical protein